MPGPGRPLNISDPNELWELFLKYVKKTKEAPIRKHVFVGKDGREADEKRERPLTYEGFKNYCRREVGEVHQYFDSPKVYTQFLDICRAIKDEIRQDQIEGGMAMIYNPSITQRLNGLTEKIEQTNIEQPLFPETKKEDGTENK